MRERIKEAGKTVLIVVLLCSALLMTVSLISDLTFGRSLPHRLGELLGLVRPEPAYAPAESMPAATEPLAISMTGGNGRGSTLGEPERTAQQFEYLGRFLGEALSSAGMPVAVELSQWERLFRGESVSFLYPGAVPMGPLCVWLGAQPSESLRGLSAGCLTLCIDGQRVSLLLKTEHWLCLATSVSPEELRQALESCRPDGSVFALEDPALSRLDPMSLLTVQTVMPKAQCENALYDGDRIDTAASLLGLNPYRDTAYTDTNGTVSFTAASGGRLQVSGGGVLRYTPVAGDQPPVEDDDTRLIEAARKLLGQLAAPWSGDAALQLTALEREERQVTLRFSYVLAGYEIWQSGGDAARLVYEGGTLRLLEWTARHYTLTGQSETLLPAQQAATIVGDGTLLRPIYLDSGSDLRCGWPS